MNRYIRNGLSIFALDLLLGAGPAEAATMDVITFMNWLIKAINGSMALITVIASMLLFKTAWEYRQRRLLYSSSNLQRLRRHRMIVSNNHTLPEINTRKAQWMGMLMGITLVIALQGPWQAFVAATLGPVTVSGNGQANTARVFFGSNPPEAERTLFS